MKTETIEGAENLDALDCWGLVELLGHKKVYGRITEIEVAGAQMVRVDVPETEKHPGFTKMYGTGALYGITPLDEYTTRLLVERAAQTPIDLWAMSDEIKKAISQTRSKLLERLSEEDWR